MRRIKQRILIWTTLIAVCIILSMVGMKHIYNSIPDRIYIDEGIDNIGEKLDYGYMISVSDAIEVSGTGSYSIECKLLHVIPIKNIQVYEVQPQHLGISGDNIGIYMEYDGLLVVDIQKIETKDGIYKTPAEGILRKGDYIKKVDGHVLKDKDDLISYVNENKGKEIAVSIQRDKEEKDVSIEPVCTSDGTYKLGVWVRDDTQGIGTLTYVDAYGNFGALGHGIVDTDGGELLKVDEGGLYHANILSIKKGKEGTPGELSGMIIYKESEKLGNISDNTECGIHGRLDSDAMSELNLKWYEVAYKEDMKIGSAQIRCCIGENIKNYDIEIEEIMAGEKAVNKNFIFCVTDEILLEETGGIVQGLSGSPVIQNGRLVGAVTHVLVNDPTRGYGIFIENMLDAAG